MGRAGEATRAARRCAPSPVRARWSRIGRLLLILPIFLAGCISEDREKQIGDQLAADVNAHLPFIEDPLLLAYVQSVGSRIARASERPDLDYRFYLINTDVVNAFALPGGHIYLTRGLIERTGNGTEFAGVVAHEIAHVAARHGVRKLERQMRTGSLVNYLYELFLGGEPAVLRENSFELANTALSARHSRRDEKEADRLAVQYLSAAGIDPEGVVTLLETLLQEEQRETTATDRMTEWFSSHPLTSSRIEEARRDVETTEIATSPPAPDVNVEAFPAFKTLVSRYGGGVSVILPR